MLLSESQLRTVIREELTQYLIEQGFLQRVGSGIKSAYQKLTGRGQQIEPPKPTKNIHPKDIPGSLYGLPKDETIRSDEEITAQEKLSSYRDQQRKKSIEHDIYYDDAYKVKSGQYYVPIQKESDIDVAIQKYKSFKPAIALSAIFDHLVKSIENKKDKIVSQNEKQIYHVFIKEIENAKKRPAGLNENENKNITSNDQELNKLKKSLIIPNSLLGKTVLAFEHFIIDDIGEELSLHRLFNNQMVIDAFNALKNISQYKTQEQGTSQYQNKKQQKSINPEKQFFGKHLDEIRKLKRRK